jgi:hypothetical protein
MGSITLRVRSIVWFVTGAVLATAVALVFINAWRVDAAPGDDDSTFVPITPCRLVDTREPGGTVLVSGEIRTIDAHGTNGPIPDSQCTIPSDAIGLSMNVTAVAASGQTFWTFWADGTAQPEASSLNPAPGQPPTPNAVTTPISSAGKFKVFNNAGTVGMVIDVNGYYTKASLGDLDGRLADAEAAIAALEAAQALGVDPTVLARIAANETGIAALDEAQPFTVASDLEFIVQAQSTVTEIRSVTVEAPVAGHVAVVASGEMTEGTEGEIVECGLMDSVTNPPSGVELRWRSPTVASIAHLSASRVFDIAAGATATYSLVCFNQNGGSTGIVSPQLTAIFTPAP